MKKLIILLVVAVVILGGYLLLRGNSPEEALEVNTPDVEVFDPVAYFSQKLQDKHIEEIGQPIEGFTPDMFMNVFPGLLPSDFDGVEAMGGAYELRDDEAVFVSDRKEGMPVTSADGSLTPKGMRTLLDNVSLRLGFSDEDRSSIDVILQTLRESLSVTKG